MQWAAGYTSSRRSVSNKMALRKLFYKEVKSKDSELQSHAGPSTSVAGVSVVPKAPKTKAMSDKKKIYKSQLSYKPEWEKKYPWVFCTNPKEGMFCRTCQKWGTPPADKGFTIMLSITLYLCRI